MYDKKIMRDGKRALCGQKFWSVARVIFHLFTSGKSVLEQKHGYGKIDQEPGNIDYRGDKWS